MQTDKVANLMPSGIIVSEEITFDSPKKLE